MEDLVKNLPSVVAKLNALHQSKCWMHEAVLCKKIGLRPGPTTSVRERLTLLVTCLRKGYARSGKDKTMTGMDPVDLLKEGNTAGILYMLHGNVEQFPRGMLEDGYTSHNPQYFAIGKPVMKLKE